MQVVPPSAFVDSSVSVPKQKFEDLTSKWARGWNTWATKDMLNHVLLPHSFGMRLGWTNGTHSSPGALVDCPGSGLMITPGLHSPNGSYTDILNATWHGASMRVQSGHTYNNNNHNNQVEDVVLRVSVLKVAKGVEVFIGFGWLFGQDGIGDLQIHREANGSVVVYARNKGDGLDAITLYTTLPPTTIQPNGLTFSVVSASEIGISSGRRRSLAEIKSILAKREASEKARISSFGTWADTYDAMHTVISWNTVFDPRQKVFTTFSRRWGFGSGTLNYAFILFFFFFSFSSVYQLFLLNNITTWKENKRTTRNENIKRS